MAPSSGRRQLHPIPSLDPLVLRSAFQNGAVKDSHVPKIWKFVIGRFDSSDSFSPQDDHKCWSHLASSSSGLPHRALDVLTDAFTLCSSRVVQWKSRNDFGSGKLIIELQDGQRIETVIIEHGGSRPRSTVCISSQVGCKMGCTFCATGTMGLRAHLTAGEILEQLLHAKKRVRKDAPLRNVVFMGMGEPLDNYQQVLAALEVIGDKCGFGLALKNVTVSTVGVPSKIVQLAADCPSVKLALSLHAPTQELRASIVPSATGNHLDRIMDAVDEYCDRTNGNKVMMEYVLIEGTNASDTDAHLLGELLAGRRASVMLNLIPYNPTSVGDENGLRPPSSETCKRFRDIVASYHRSVDAPGCMNMADAKAGAPILCTVRWSTTAGQRNESACGQLAVETAARDMLVSRRRGGARKAVRADIQDIEDHGADLAEAPPQTDFDDGRDRLAILSHGSVLWIHWASLLGIAAVACAAALGVASQRRLRLHSVFHSMMG